VDAVSAVVGFRREETVTDQWSAASCEKALALLVKADIALKETTVSNAEQILMSLVLGLCATRRRKSA